MTDETFGIRAQVTPADEGSSPFTMTFTPEVSFYQEPPGLPSNYYYQFNWHDGDIDGGDNISPIYFTAVPYPTSGVEHTYQCPVGTPVGSYGWVLVEIWGLRSPSSARTQSTFRHFKIWNGIVGGGGSGSLPDLAASTRSKSVHFYAVER